MVKLNKVIVFLALFSMTPIYLFAAWEPDTRLSFGSTNAYTTFNNAWSIAVNTDTVIAVWFDSRQGATNYELYYRRSINAGANWEPETRLTDYDGYSGYPCVGIQDSCIHVVWFDEREGNYEIFYKRSFDAGITWGSDTRLTNNPVISDFPSLAISDSLVHVVWTDERDGNWEIYYIKSTDYGNTWGSETRLTNDGAWSSDVSITAYGPYVQIAWNDDRIVSAYHDIFYKRSTDYGESWGSDTNLTNIHNAYGPCIASAESLVYVAWLDRRHGVFEIYFKRSTNNGITWEPDVRMTADSAISQSPSLAASDSLVHMIWCEYKGSILGEIFYNRSLNRGVSWNGETRLTYDSLRSWYPSMAVGDSAVHVIWTDDRPGYYNVFYKRDPIGNIGIDEQFESPVSLTLPCLTIFSGPLLLPKDKTYKVFDITGRVVMRDKIKPGIYFIEVDGKIVNKVIKIK